MIERYEFFYNQKERNDNEKFNIVIIISFFSCVLLLIFLVINNLLKIPSYSDFSFIFEADYQNYLNIDFSKKKDTNIWEIGDIQFIAIWIVLIIIVCYLYNKRTQLVENIFKLMQLNNNDPTYTTDEPIISY
jgi:hypothetical protein